MIRGGAAFALLLTLAHCDPSAPAAASASDAATNACEPERGLVRAAEVLAADDPCRDWVAAPAAASCGSRVRLAVRGSLPHDGVQYVRALRMSYVHAKVEAAAAAPDPDLRARVRHYLETN